LDSTFTKESLYTLQSLKVYIPSLHIVCTYTWRLQNESLKMITNVLEEFHIIDSPQSDSDSDIIPQPQSQSLPLPQQQNRLFLTSDLKGQGTRCDEIVIWLQQYIQQYTQHSHRHANNTDNPLYLHYIILDDQDILVNENQYICDIIESHFYHINDEYGLRYKDLSSILDILNGFVLKIDMMDNDTCSCDSTIQSNENDKNECMNMNDNDNEIVKYIIQYDYMKAKVKSRSMSPTKSNNNSGGMNNSNDIDISQMNRNDFMK